MAPIEPTSSDLSAAPEGVAVPASPPNALPQPARTWVAPALVGAAVGVSVLALAGSGVVWFKLEQAEQELARRATENVSTSVDARTLAQQTDAVTKDLQARLTVAELRLSEVSVQRTQLDELMLAVSRTRDDTLLQDLESILRLAQQQAELTGSTQPLILTLQSTDRRLVHAAQPRLQPLRRAIARDIERLQAAVQVDLPALAGRFDDLVRQTDEWPLLSGVSSPAAASPAKPVEAPPRKMPAAKGVQPVAELKSAWEQAWVNTRDWWSDWSVRVWSYATARGSELVRVNRIDRPEAALLSPDQAFFLRENLKLRLMNARMALLARRLDMARNDTEAAEALLNRYFDVKTRPVQLARDALSQLQRDIRLTVPPKLDDSLDALKMVASGR